MEHTKTIIELSVPETVKVVAETLHTQGFEVYVVGGCVRGLLMNREIADWDLTTNATPEEIQRLFPHTVYENDYGTVGVIFDEAEIPTEKVIEVTPYRKEGEYTDNRRPDTVEFTATLQEDLLRRDFTINALAYNPMTSELIDNHNGIQDLQKKVLRTVGNPADRFEEDALRLLRAVRIATQLEFEIEEQTLKTLQEKAEKITTVAEERIRDEFVKLIMAKQPAMGIFFLEKTKLLHHIIPELREGLGIEQNQAHKFDVFEHNVRTLEHAGVKQFDLHLRLSALMHDISKPATREWSNEKKDWTFHAHEVVGARVAKKILKRLKFSKEMIEVVTLLVRWHMFFSDTEKISLTAVRRMIARVGEKHIWDLIDLRRCDRIGTGRPKEQPYRLRKYVSLVEEVLREPVTPGVLTINGKMLISELGMKPGPRIGNILHALLAEVLEDPEKNIEKTLLERAGELNRLSDEELRSEGEKGRLRRMEEEEEQITQIRKKYGVR